MSVEGKAARLGIDPYLDWVEKEGLLVHGGYGVYLFEAETRLWPRMGVKAAAVHLQGRGDFANMFLYEIPPGASSSPQRRLFEEVVYVLDGSGSTQVELGGATHSFEWGARSMFAIPLNAKYRLFNNSGRERALLVSTTSMPLVMNTFHDERFVFDLDFDFADRAGPAEHFEGGGDLIMARPGSHIWETTFVPDLEAIELQPWEDRGGGSSNIMFALADGIMHAHLSEMPVGTYKKAHKHRPGAHVMCVSGTGYSLLWFEGDKDFERLDWKHGMVFPPADRQFHQHFNTSSKPARYFATNVGNLRYPLTAAKRRESGTGAPDAKNTVSLSVKHGGDQIEYEDQDPRIHPLYVEECRKNGVEPRMKKFFPADAKR